MSEDVRLSVQQHALSAWRNARVLRALAEHPDGLLNLHSCLKLELQVNDAQSDNYDVATLAWRATPPGASTPGAQRSACNTTARPCKTAKATVPNAARAQSGKAAGWSCGMERVAPADAPNSGGQCQNDAESSADEAGPSGEFLTTMT